MKKYVVSILSFLTLMMVAMPAFAQQGGGTDPKGWVALAAAICMGLGTFGGALAQGKTASAAV